MYKRKSVGNYILLALEKVVDGAIDLNNFINHPGPFGLGWDYPVKKSLLSLTVKRLRENGLVDFISDDKLAIRLTEEGREKAVLARIMLEEKKWDGKWRFVIFDIPEKRRLARDLLRIKLKAWGFKPWQQSVWVTKKNCTKLLREYIKKVGIEDWVMVIESDNVGR